MKRMVAHAPFTSVIAFAQYHPSVGFASEFEDVAGAGGGPEVVFEAVLLQAVAYYCREIVVAAKVERDQQFWLEGGCESGDSAIASAHTLQERIADLESYVHRRGLIDSRQVFFDVLLRRSRCHVIPAAVITGEVDVFVSHVDRERDALVS